MKMDDTILQSEFELLAKLAITVMYFLNLFSITAKIYYVPKILGITYVRQDVCMYLSIYVCLCDCSHTVQRRALKLWHNIPHVTI